MSTRTTGTGHRDIRLVLGEMARELATPDPEEITARHDLDDLKRQIREKQPSVPEIHNHVTIATRRDSSEPPSSTPSLDAHVPLLGHVKAKGTRAVVAVLVVVALVVLGGIAARAVGTQHAQPAAHPKD